METTSQPVTLTAESANRLLDRLIRQQEWPIDLRIGHCLGTNVPMLTIYFDGDLSPHSIVLQPDGRWRIDTSLPICP